MMTSAMPATRRVSSRISADPAVAAKATPTGTKGVPTEFRAAVP
jgi:hypothetical protein